MLDVIVGIIICVFFLLGLYEGIVKSLGSVALAFFSLYLAKSTIGFLAKGASQFSDPSFLGTAVIFLVVFVVTYGLLDLLLNIILKKIIMVVVLGPLDKVGGFMIGGFKGMLICGIVLQMMLYFPVSAQTKKRISESTISQLAIGTYRFAYPYAKKVAPKTENFMEGDLLKKKEVGKIIDGLENVKPGEVLDKVKEIGEENKEQVERVKDLLKKQKLLPTVPQGNAR